MSRLVVSLTLLNAYDLAFYLFSGLALIGLLLSSAIISGSEVAFFSLSHKQIMHCKRAKESKAQKILHLLKDPRRLLATILILNNLINVAFVTLSTYMLWKLFGVESIHGLILLGYTILTAVIIVLFGEVMPKTYANQNNLRFAKLFANFITLSVSALKPLSGLLMGMGNFLEKSFTKKGYALSIDKLNKALELTTEKEASEEEKEILKGIVNFGTLTAKQVMRSRMDITAIDIATNFHELMDIVNKSGYSRLPVYRETVDKIEGILYTKDLLPYLDKNEDFQWQSLLRKCFFVPENKKIDRLLLEFQWKRIHMAIIVDEYGGTSGLITMEDIIEEIIGDISDEFDQDEVIYNQIDKKTFVFESKISLNDFCKVVGEDPSIFEEVKGESESLGGLLLEIHGSLPQVGEKINHHHFIFTITAVDARKIKKVQVQIEPKKDHPPAE